MDARKIGSNLIQHSLGIPNSKDGLMRDLALILISIVEKLILLRRHIIQESIKNVQIYGSLKTSREINLNMILCQDSESLSTMVLEFLEICD